VQQWLPIQLLSEPTQRVAGDLIGYVGVDLHRDSDLAVPQDAHCHPGVNVERGEQGRAGAAQGVGVDVADTGPAAAGCEVTVEVARLVGSSVAVVMTRQGRVMARQGRSEGHTTKLSDRASN